MMLVALILIPLLGGLLAWPAGRWGSTWPRGIALAAMAMTLLLAVVIWMETTGQSGPWLRELNLPWIEPLAVRFHLALDGLSLLLVLLTALLGTLSVAVSWTEIHHSVGFFHANLLWVLAGILGVFLAMDLFLFYFFWEVMLVPMYFLIALWGHENRFYASVKFFIFTQLSGLLMLLAILGLVFVHGRESGRYTFDYFELLATPMTPQLGMLLMLGFLAAFAVKLPVVPLHTWLPDAHTEAPTAGSVILAGLLLKTGAYGLLRFVLPLFPAAAAEFRPTALALGVIGVLYGALLAFSQVDLKRMVAYTSVSHMGFVLLGVFAQNQLALQGAVIEILCHGLSTGALFVLAGLIQQRISTRDVRNMGGMWSTAPRMGGAATVFALASLGLPGLGNFVGEFLVLLGTYQVSPAAAILASLGLVSSTVYSLWMIQVVFLGPGPQARQVPDLDRRETAVLAVLLAGLVWLGVYPRPVLRTSGPAMEVTESLADRTPDEALLDDHPADDSRLAGLRPSAEGSKP